MQTLLTSGKDAAAAPSQAGALTDEEVVVRVRAGDTPFFEVLMRRYNQRLYRAARAILQNDADAEDAVQRAAVVAMREAGATIATKFSEQPQIKEWLGGIGNAAPNAVGPQAAVDGNATAESSTAPLE